MEIDVVQCLVRVNQDGNTGILSVAKAGPDALPITEIPILRTLHEISEGGEEDCCITEVIHVGSITTTRANEIERLKLKYKSPVVDHNYPGGRAMPSKLEDCEIPASSYAKVKAPPKAKEA